MGTQASVFYGAAEFSRILDLLILADATNLANLATALLALDAEVIAVPPLEQRHLLRGHAVHLRTPHDRRGRRRANRFAGDGRFGRREEDSAR